MPRQPNDHLVCKSNIRNIHGVADSFLVKDNMHGQVMHSSRGSWIFPIGRSVVRVRDIMHCNITSKLHQLRERQENVGKLNVVLVVMNKL